MIATAKHFVGYGMAARRHQPVRYAEIGARHRDLFAYPFEAAIQFAGLRSVMNSYADVDGVPAGASREVLTDLLRGHARLRRLRDLRLPTLEHLVDRQKLARRPGEAGRLALAAGLDTEIPLPRLRRRARRRGRARHG